MKWILAGSVVLGWAWAGSAGPCTALPVLGPNPIAEAQPALLLVRHHRHHHHWRRHYRHSRRSQPAPAELYPPAAQGESAPLLADPAPEAGSAQPPMAAPAETAPPAAPRRSTRWVNPDKR